jgi:hypothetical protein
LSSFVNVLMRGQLSGQELAGMLAQRCAATVPPPYNSCNPPPRANHSRRHRPLPLCQPRSPTGSAPRQSFTLMSGVLLNLHVWACSILQ